MDDRALLQTELGGLSVGLLEPSGSLLINARSLADLKPLACQIRRPPKSHATCYTKQRMTFGATPPTGSGFWLN